MTGQHLREALPAVLAPALGDAVRVENLSILTGGASRATWAFDAVCPEGRRALILRTGQPDELHAGMELEARAQALAAAAGAPVPDVLVADDSPLPLGTPFLICGAIAGQTIPRKIARGLEIGIDGRDADARRGRLLAQCASALAAIHRADISRAAIDEPHIPEQDPLALWRAQLDAMGDTTATFEWAFRWLSTNRPAPSPPSLVHGDFRLGNLIVEGGELAAVLDWELVHIGDVAEDLGWFCIRAWRFGAPGHLGAAGLGSIEDFLSAYQRAGGTAVDRVAIRWWLILATLRWGVICRYQAERHLSGQTPSVELAAIGRRVCETEWDLLDLLEGGGQA
jgi:aminoglycoside phosphotransferase (APT) family kinase protein